MIEVRNLSKTFGTVQAVIDLSFDVKAGEIFAFLGPNGAGKTTTIKMLTTLLRPTTGTMKLDGLDPVTRQNEARQRFGIVFQDPSLDADLTAWERIAYCARRLERADDEHRALQNVVPLSRRLGDAARVTAAVERLQVLEAEGRR